MSSRSKTARALGIVAALLVAAWLWLAHSPPASEAVHLAPTEIAPGARETASIALAPPAAAQRKADSRGEVEAEATAGRVADPTSGAASRAHGYTVTATIRLADTRELLVDAFVQLVVTDATGNEIDLARDRSDSSGEVRLSAEFRPDVRIKVTPNDERAPTGLTTYVTLPALGRPELALDVLVDPYPRFDFHARVIDAATLRPVAGLRASAPAGAVVPLDATSDSEGRLALRVTHPSHARTFSIGAPAYGAIDVALDRAHPDAARATIVLVRAAAALRGRVLEADGTPHARAAVTIDPVGYLSWAEPTTGPGRVSVFADDDGRYEARALVPDVHYQLDVATQGGGPPERRVPVLLRPGEVRELDVRLPARLVLRGRVLDESGRPVEGATVSLASRDTSEVSSWGFERVLRARSDTASDGAYRFESVPAGAHALVVEARHDPTDEEADAVAGRARLELDLPETGAEFVCDVTLHRGESIEGFVRDETGAAVANCVVFLSASGGGDSTADTTEAGGAFVLRGLARGSYVLRAQGSDGRVSLLTTVASGARNVVLTLPVGGEVVGNVVDLDGSPVRSASIGSSPLVVFRSDTGEVRWCDVAIDGSFSALHVSAGQWHVSVEGRGLASAIHTLTTPGRGHVEAGTFVLEPTCRVLLVASTSSTAPDVTRFEVRRGEELVERGALVRGFSRTLDVPSGALQLVTHEGAVEHVHARVELAPGAETIVRLGDEP